MQDIVYPQHILVIGNGFDLAHGLKTKYSHFLAFVEAAIHDEPDTDICSDIEVQTFALAWKTSQDETMQKRYNEFCNLVVDNKWIKHFFEVYKFMGKDWVDFEREIKNVISSIEDFFDAYEGNPRIINSYMLGKTFYYYLNREIGKAKNKSQIRGVESSILQSLLSDLENFTRAFEIYLTTYVASQRETNSIREIRQIEFTPEDRVVSFNYTETFDLHYNGPGNPVAVTYIHGRVDPDGHSMGLIMGTGDYRDDNGHNNQPFYLNFIKFFMRSIHGERLNFSELIPEGKEGEALNNPKIIFFGHSLDITDEDIIRPLLEYKGADVTIYYHNEDSRKNMAANLAVMLGQRKYIELVDSENARIKFVRILDV